MFLQTAIRHQRPHIRILPVAETFSSPSQQRFCECTCKRYSSKFFTTIRAIQHNALTTQISKQTIHTKMTPVATFDLNTVTVTEVVAH